MSTLADDYRELEDVGHKLRSETHAYWTDTALYPSATHNVAGNQDVLNRDWQSFGQLLVSQLAAKMTGSLFPLDKPFFRLDSSGAPTRPQTYPGAGADEASTAKLERDACARLQWYGNYAKLQQLVKMLIALGNALMVFRKDGRVSAYTTRNYVVRRDGAGGVLQVIMRESLAYPALPVEVQARVSKPTTPYQKYDLYTGWRFEPHQFPNEPTLSPAYVEAQECEGKTTKESTPLRAALCPAVPLVWELMDGENYGRGLVEANSGDFARYSSLSEAITLYEIEMCRVLNLVLPGATADIDAMNRAESGEFVSANPDAVRAHEFGEPTKIAELRADLMQIEARLSRAFGYTGNVRDAERVTKEEILQNAREADNITGGQFSLFAHSWHIPLAMLLINHADPETFSKLVTSKGASLEVVTGIPALSRSSKIRSMLQAAQEANAIAAALAPLSQRVSPERIIEMALIGNGIDPSEVYRTQEELQAMQQSAAPINPQNPEQVQQAMQGVMNG